MLLCCLHASMIAYPKRKRNRHLDSGQYWKNKYGTGHNHNMGGGMELIPRTWHRQLHQGRQGRQGKDSRGTANPDSRLSVACCDLCRFERTLEHVLKPEETIGESREPPMVTVVKCCLRSVRVLGGQCVELNPNMAERFTRTMC